MNTVQESIVRVTNSGYKSKPIIDAKGYAVFPDCDSRVNCGTIGLANLEKRHRGNKICKILAVQQKRDTKSCHYER